ncbi:unnamed protein product [Brugia pahangi]|uniref:START domain-containing protein n=1 Tax=Brugia pahangi TaxID=6280 RepID=A0A0N4SWW6_BRUPA|nr:unnamed protein product [Brugia pahangi]
MVIRQNVRCCKVLVLNWTDCSQKYRIIQALHAYIERFSIRDRCGLSKQYVWDISKADNPMFTSEQNPLSFDVIYLCELKLEWQGQRKLLDYAFVSPHISTFRKNLPPGTQLIKPFQIDARCGQFSAIAARQCWMQVGGPDVKGWEVCCAVTKMGQMCGVLGMLSRGRIDGSRIRSVEVAAVSQPR